MELFKLRCFFCGAVCYKNVTLSKTEINKLATFNCLILSQTSPGFYVSAVQVV